MKKLIVISHAQSEHHTEKKVGGWYDTGLTELGHSQAEATATEVKRMLEGKEAKLFSSDLLRACETADWISRAISAPMELISGLRENSYGRAEGKPQRWLDDRFKFPPKEGNRLDHVVCEGAETRRKFAERVYASMEKVYTESDEHAVVVSHGFALTFIISWWIKLPVEHNAFANFSSSPGGMSLLVEDDRFNNRTVEFLNRKEHTMLNNAVDTTATSRRASL